jgi:mannose-6-phosphate isomerase-like protein (cupin superfamily)
MSAPRTLENPMTGERTLLRETARSSDGRRWEIEAFLPAYTGKTPAAHFHPTFDESFDIVEGRARYRLGKQELDAGPGDHILVPRNTAHMHPWSIGAEGLHLRQRIELEPPNLAALEKFDVLVETLYALARAGKLDKEGRPNLWQLAVIAHHIQPEGYVAGMPIGVQRVLFGLLAAVARKLGYQMVYPNVE